MSGPGQARPTSLVRAPSALLARVESHCRSRSTGSSISQGHAVKPTWIFMPFRELKPATTISPRRHQPL
jgi:hypothetical protein